MTENAKKEVEKIKKIYLEEDVCMFDLLADIRMENECGITFEDAFEIYGELINWANGDIITICRAE